MSKYKNKPWIVTVEYKVNELNKIKPNSTKMVQELKEVKWRARNIYLSEKQEKII